MWQEMLAESLISKVTETSVPQAQEWNSINNLNELRRRVWVLSEIMALVDTLILAVWDPAHRMLNGIPNPQKLWDNKFVVV